eukprot:SAG11_NODE_33095_length_279_cov_0.577778_1_plen_54_part_01
MQDGHMVGVPICCNMLIGTHSGVYSPRRPLVEQSSATAVRIFIVAVFVVSTLPM